MWAAQDVAPFFDELTSNETLADCEAEKLCLLTFLPDILDRRAASLQPPPLPRMWRHNAQPVHRRGCQLRLK